mmetsp:Transcript_113039/g.365029  ORF Transcript_113039/g.365029 Transcript_113039/m.365029 type:complete len:332 (-) Transcript_113039:827-1822(-)
MQRRVPLRRGAPALEVQQLREGGGDALAVLALPSREIQQELQHWPFGLQALQQLVVLFGGAPHGLGNGPAEGLKGANGAVGVRGLETQGGDLLAALGQQPAGTHSSVWVRVVQKGPPPRLRRPLLGLGVGRVDRRTHLGVRWDRRGGLGRLWVCGGRVRGLRLRGHRVLARQLRGRGIRGIRGGLCTGAHRRLCRHGPGKSLVEAATEALRHSFGELRAGPELLDPAVRLQQDLPHVRDLLLVHPLAREEQRQGLQHHVLGLDAAQQFVRDGQAAAGCRVHDAAPEVAEGLHEPALDVARRQPSDRLGALLQQLARLLCGGAGGGGRRRPG